MSINDVMFATSKWAVGSSVVALLACESKPPPSPTPSPDAVTPEKAPEAEAQAEAEDLFQPRRSAMVRTQLRGRDIRDEAVLAAMEAIPRHEFVLPEMVHLAYADEPLPIGHDVTISQPYIVALMTELAQVKQGDRVLDIGTGSGYQAAVLAQMGAEVYGIEIIEPLAEQAADRLKRLGYAAQIEAGDGYRGWPEHAPFDAIIIAAAAPRIPQPLLDQLAEGGRLVLPVGQSARAQKLVVMTRTQRGFEKEEVLPVAFVPMAGEVRE